MAFIQTYAKEIVAILVPFITWLLNSSQRHRPRLIRGTRHAFTFLVDQPLIDPQTKQVVQPKQTVNTASVVIHNSGKQTATKLEVVFNWKPMCLNMWPSRHMEEKIEADGRYVIIFDSLAPNEFVGLELLAVNTNLPGLVNVRSDQGTATEVPMGPQRIIPTWQRKLWTVLIWVGLAAVAYLVLVGLQWIVLRTPA